MQHVPRGALLACLAITAAAVGQEPAPTAGPRVSVPGAAVGERKPGFVLVTSAAGEPMAGFEVVCVANIDPDPWLAAPDVVRARTDARGRARADLLQGVPYDVHAFGAAAADGTRQATAVVPGAACGRTLAIVATTQIGPRTVRVAHAGDGPAVGKSLRWRLGETQYHGEVALQDAMAGLPPLPGDVTLTLLDAQYEPVWSAPARTAGETRIEVPAPRSVPCVVKDEDGKPVAGVGIWQRVGAKTDDHWRLCATTDAQGQADARVFARGDPMAKAGVESALLAARKDGCRESLTGFDSYSYYVDGVVQQRSDPPGPFPFTLVASAPLAGRITRAGAPLAGLRLSAAVVVRLYNQRGDTSSWSSARRCFRATTGADGSFAFSCLPEREETLALRFLLPPEHGGGIGIAARHTIAVEPGRASAMLDLAQARTIALQVVGPQQEPAVEAGALLLPISGGKVVTGLLERVPLDSVGRARLSVLPGEWFLLVTDGRDFHAEVLQVDSGDAPITANVRLEPLASLRGTLLTADGKPAVDARITLATSGHTGSDFPPLDRCLVTLLHPLNSEFVGRTKVAADGSFEVRFLEVKNASSNASAHRDGSTLQFELRAGREVELRFK